MAHTVLESGKCGFRVAGNELPRTSGNVLHSPRLYDLTVWLAFLGKENSFREKALNLGRVTRGESVLDVGCGTGTLAIAAKKRVGAAGIVRGVDASIEMLATAEKKATKAVVEVFFKSGVAEAIPFPDGQFNVVLSTVMLHHLRRKHGYSAQKRFAVFSSRMDVCLSLTSRDSVIRQEAFCLTFTVPTGMFERRISLPCWLTLA